MSKRANFHPVHAVYDGVFNALSCKVDLNNPTVDMIQFDDIAAVLSKIGRFGCHTRRLYTVAQHSCLMAEMVDISLMGEVLFHDAAETYLGDVIKPLKVLLGKAYTDIEHRFEEVIAKKFGVLILDPGIKAIIKKADNLAVYLEQEAFQKSNFKPLKQFLHQRDAPDDFTRAWPPDEAEARFRINYDIYKKMSKNG